jgi:gluconate kinase
VPILVLSGPVGAGKTTVARELIAHAPEGTAYIEGDAFWPFLVAPRKGQNRQQAFLMTLRAMFAAAWHYHRDDYRVLLDFSVPPAFLPGARKLLRETPFHYVVLLPPVAVCAERAASRAEGAIVDYTFYAEFYADFDVDEPFVVRDALRAEDLADLIRADLRGERFRV